VPLYNFKCGECEWDKDRVFRASSRPSEIECESCGGVAKYRIVASKYQSNSARHLTNYSKEKRGLSLQMFKCHDCESTFEKIIDHGKGESVDDLSVCEKCGSENTTWKPFVRIDRFSEQFPYFDNGLGIWLKNKEHRRQVCKERGIVPVGNSFDEDKVFSQFDSRRDKEEKEYNDYVDRLDNAPEFLDYRKAVDQGKFSL
jgi:NAD-dependent SIR2 family protein deacetylase|tara:strand:- start:1575 stop:2174 length:600 start_codon:yes stop_codon:yes gene_type:complete